MIDLHPGLDQSARDVGVAAVGRSDQAGAVERILGVDVGAVFQGQFEQLEESFAGGNEVGALNGLVLGVDVGAAANERAGPRQVVGPGRGNQLRIEHGLLLRIGTGSSRRLPRLLAWPRGGAWNVSRRRRTRQRWPRGRGLTFGQRILAPTARGEEDQDS